MKALGLRDFKHSLCKQLRCVKQGQTILLLDRGTPVAVLSPISAADDWDGILEALTKRGLVRPAIAQLPDSFFKSPRAP
jgi:antitoxin (DNA-binding transcriptional repressor) of toxin-antitoxin stability system